MIVTGPVTTILLEGAWLDLLLPRTITLKINGICAELNSFMPPLEWSSSRIVWEGSTVALLDGASNENHTSDAGEPTAHCSPSHVLTNSCGSVVHFPNPARAQIEIQSRRAATDTTLSSLCKVQFDDEICTSAQWLVRDTEPRLLQLSLQFMFLRICMELRQGYTSTAAISNFELIAAIDACRPSQLFCLLAPCSF